MCIFIPITRWCCIIFCWFYSLSFWSTLSSHFGIGVNSVLCSGSLEHFEHLLSHFLKRGILKVLLGQKIKSSVWGVLWNLVFLDNLGVVLFSLHLVLILGHQNPFQMTRTEACEMPEHHLKSHPRCVTATSKPQIPCASVPENPWHHKGTTTAESFNFFSMLNQSWLCQPYNIISICLPTNML